MESTAPRTLLRPFASAIVAVAALAAAMRCGSPARAAEPLLHQFGGAALSPDGARVVSIESDEPAVDGAPVREHLVVRPAGGGPPRDVVLPCAPDPDCVPSQPAWAPDGSRFVFVLRAPKSKTRTLYAVDPAGTALTKLLAFEGNLGTPRFSARGELAVLATANARKETGATQAGAPIVGEIGASFDEQRIAVVGGGTVTWVSPPDLFVYEYDWIPSGSGFVGTAAHGDGDDNWWIARLYRFDRTGGAPVQLARPQSPQEQLAVPRVSADGRYVAFIGGLMSDFGSTGGDVYAMPLAGGPARDLTPNLAASPSALEWSCDGARLYVSALASPYRTIAAIDVAHGGSPQERYRGSESIGGSAQGPLGTACAGETSAVIRQSFERPPEIALGAIGAWHDLTHENRDIAPETTARSVTWQNDGHAVQGWLLAPRRASGGAHPLIVSIHGGPAAAWQPAFVGRGTPRELLRRGYYLFLPNPRGSFGAGEAFTLGNVRDFGYGDLRDDLAGIDAVEKLAPIDDARLGITGGSYGGFMTMWAVTQTHRFKAAVGGAGISDWISYYGENGIDEWMIPYFGASAYDDPAVYRKSSPIEYIKNVTTPTFAYVGERDVECPAPQSLEFWHALETLGVPTQLVIYDGEGHGIRSPQHRADVTKRTLAWFDRYLH